MPKQFLQMAALATAMVLGIAGGKAQAAAAAPQVNPALVADLVIANHILFDQSVVDAFGHVSVRHDKRPDRFFMSRNRAPGDVTAADILEFTLESEPVAANPPELYSERYIHGEIYRTRPDVIAIVHSHSPAVVTLSVVQNARLRPVMHFAGFIGEAAPVFEVRNVAGDASNLMIRSSMMGAALAKTLGAGNLVLMRGHGAATVGSTLAQVVHRAVYAEVNARMQIDAMKLGPVTYLTAGEARATATAPNYERAWDFWKAQSEARRR